MTCKKDLGLTRRNVSHNQDLVYTSEEFCFSGMIFSYAIASWPSGQRKISVYKQLGNKVLDVLNLKKGYICTWEYG